MAVMAVMMMRVVIAVIGKMAMKVENAIMALRLAPDIHSVLSYDFSYYFCDL